MEWHILKINLYNKCRALMSFANKTLLINYFITILSSHSKKTQNIYAFCRKGELIWCFQNTLLCTTDMASYLSPSRGHSQLSPVAVVRIAWHCCRVLWQAWALSSLSNSVEPSFPHWCTLPHPGAPFFLSALQTPTSATVESVHLNEYQCH